MKFGTVSRTLLTVLVLGGFLTAGTTVSSAAPQSDQISKESFETRLGGSDLQRWQGLTSDQQSSILKTVNDPRLIPDLTAEDAKQISPDLKIEVTQGTQASPSPSGRNATLMAGQTYEVTSYYQKNSSQFGVPTGWSRIDYTYVTGNGVVLSDRSCRASYNQFVPFRTINVQTNSWVANGEGTCVAYWSISRGLGVAGTDNYEQGMTVNGPGIVRTWGP